MIPILIILAVVAIIAIASWIVGEFHRAPEDNDDTDTDTP